VKAHHLKQRCIKLKFHLLRQVTTRHDTTDPMWRIVMWRVVGATRVVTSVSLSSCVSRCACSNIADDEAVGLVLEFSILRSGFASISGTILEKVRWTCPPQSTLWRCPWTRAALVVTSVSRSAVRQARQSTSRLFLVSKMAR